jgi:hypothetical protein
MLDKWNYARAALLKDADALHRLFSRELIGLDGAAEVGKAMIKKALLTGRGW